MQIRTSPLMKQKSKRDKALDFAKKIKKPKINLSPERFAIEFEDSRAKMRLQDSEQDDRLLRLEKEKIKLFFRL